MTARRLLIVNPNANLDVTRWLADEARRVAGNRFAIEAVNAESGLAALETPEHVRIASEAVVRAIKAARPDLALIAAFGDPGLVEARALGLPVAGLGEAGLRAAGAGGRRFGIVTLGAAMQEAIERKVEALGLGAQLASLRFLPGSIADYVAQRDAAPSAIAREAEACTLAGAKVVLLGGAPFAGQAARITASVCLLDGVASAMKELELQG